MAVGQASEAAGSVGFGREGAKQMAAFLLLVGYRDDGTRISIH
jgi:hypothetical protein